MKYDTSQIHEKKILRNLLVLLEKNFARIATYLQTVCKILARNVKLQIKSVGVIQKPFMILARSF